MARLRAAGHDEGFALLDRADELRSRLFRVGAALLFTLGLCLWQNDLMLELANRPLPGGFEPFTLSVTEPFVTTVTVAFYGATLLALPVLLWQTYAFLVGALAPGERRRLALFLAVAAPLLFLAGAAFAYFVLVPLGLEFLLGFNETQFDIQLRARDYYAFLGIGLLGFGLMFQLPLVTLLAARAGFIEADSLVRHRRYAVLALAVAAALTTSPDPITMLVALVPLLLLYELAVLMARALVPPPR